MKYSSSQFASAIQAVSPASLSPPPSYWRLGMEGRDQALAPRVKSKTYGDIHEHAHDLIELVYDLTKGWLAHPSETQKFLAVFWGLASAS